MRRLDGSCLFQAKAGHFDDDALLHFAADFAIAVHGLLLVAIELVGIVCESVAIEDGVDFIVKGIADAADIAFEIAGKLCKTAATDVVGHIAACNGFDF